MELSLPCPQRAGRPGFRCLLLYRRQFLLLQNGMSSHRHTFTQAKPKAQVHPLPRGLPGTDEMMSVKAVHVSFISTLAGQWRFYLRSPSSDPNPPPRVLPHLAFPQCAFIITTLHISLITCLLVLPVTVFILLSNTTQWLRADTEASLCHLLVCP